MYEDCIPLHCAPVHCCIRIMPHRMVAMPQCMRVVPLCRADDQTASADALRLARHAMARGKLLQQLLQRLATVPETVELARATGLTLPQILYNAQMIRTWSLLLRNAQRQGCLTHTSHACICLAIGCSFYTCMSICINTLYLLLASPACNVCAYVHVTACISCMHLPMQ